MQVEGTTEEAPEAVIVTNDSPQPVVLATVEPDDPNVLPDKKSKYEPDQDTTVVINNDEESNSDFYKIEDKCCCHVSLCCHRDMSDIAHRTRMPKNATDAGRLFCNLITLQSKIIGLIMLVGLCFWNITKLPYYMVPKDEQPMNSVNYNETYCNATNPLSYKCHGIEGSINLGHWVENYRGGKITAPPIFFLAVHLVLGVTVLLMAAATIVYPKFRKQYSIPFFFFSIILGAHTFPATLLVHPIAKVALFSFTAAGVMFCGVLGLITIYYYDRIGEHHAERLLIACYTIITVGSCGAGMAEFGQIFANVSSHAATGEWPVIATRKPSPKSGRTVFDGDGLEMFGWVWTCLWIIIVWGILPTVEILIWRGYLPENTWSQLGKRLLSSVDWLWTSGGNAKIEPKETA